MTLTTKFYVGQKPEISIHASTCHYLIWSSGEDPWVSPRRPGFRSQYGNESVGHPRDKLIELSYHPSIIHLLNLLLTQVLSPQDSPQGVLQRYIPAPATGVSTTLCEAFAVTELIKGETSIHIVGRGACEHTRAHKHARTWVTCFKGSILCLTLMSEKASRMRPTYPWIRLACWENLHRQENLLYPRLLTIRSHLDPFPYIHPIIIAFIHIYAHL